MKAYFLLLTICLFSQQSFTQEENWDVYLAQYEKGPGSTVLNMSLKNIAPVKALPFIVVSGLSLKNCGADGFPDKSQFEVFYRASDSVISHIRKMFRNEHAGTFTYQCERLEYIYVADTTGIRPLLEWMYKKYFPSYSYYLSIKPDEKWSAYLEFLFPNEETQEIMSNTKVVMQLQQAGDNLTKERIVDHWAFFSTEKDRDCFITQVTQQKFKVGDKAKVPNLKNPYSVRITRVDKVDIDTITKVTTALRKQALQCNGEYDGWESVVVK